MTLPELAVKHRSPVWLATVLDLEGEVLKTGLDANYSYVVGVTTQKDDYIYCKERFKGVPSVRLFHGEDMVLHEVIKELIQPITFCLDARSEPAPALIQELGVLKHHRIKTHTLIVRNVSLFGKPESGGIMWPQVEEVILRINDLYRFTAHQEADAVVATFP